MRSSFLRNNRHFPLGRLGSDEDSFTGGEPPDSTASPAKPSLTGGAGPYTYLSSGQAADQAGISSLDENYLAIPLI
jgi:hypothetical protein